MDQSERPPTKLLRPRSPHLPRRRRRRRRARRRRRRIGRHGRDVRLINTVWNTGAIHTARVVIVHIKETARAAELLVVTRAQHVAGAEGGRSSGGGERSAAEALFCVFETGVCFIGGLTEGDAGFDGHTACVGVGGAAQEAPGCRLLVAAFADVGADGFDRGWRHIGRQIVHA